MTRINPDLLTTNELRGFANISSWNMPNAICVPIYIWGNHTVKDSLTISNWVTSWGNLILALH